MKAGLYLRVSTTDQTVENQRLELEAYCSRQGWDVAEVYADEGISGSKSDRPALNKMLADAAAGKFEVIAVYKIDRLARSTVDLLGILGELKRHGVHFCSVTQNIDTSTSHGKMLMSFLAAISEFERDTLIERVRSGIERARAEGVRFGRPRAGFDVNAALQMKHEGFSWAQVAREVRVSKATVRRMLTPMLKTPAAVSG